MKFQSIPLLDVTQNSSPGSLPYKITEHHKVHSEVLNLLSFVKPWYSYTYLEKFSFLTHCKLFYKYSLNPYSNSLYVLIHNLHILVTIWSLSLKHRIVHNLEKSLVLKKDNYVCLFTKNMYLCMPIYKVFLDLHTWK